MKGLLKLSKISWLILSAGVFLVILAGLGITRSQQFQEENALTEELGLSEARLNNIQVAQLQQQNDELQQRIKDSQEQLDIVKERLHQPVESVDVTDKFFVIAENCDVLVMNLSTTTISENILGDIDCSSISISASVQGDLDDLIDFIISLNNGFATGCVRTAQISFSTTGIDEGLSSSIQMIVYSYMKEAGNG